jgi:PHD/YefM family antitoxin component YafN of YafNO toxin-antitoxin module
MITVAATEFSKNFGRYREMVQREAVAVTSHDRVTGYFVSSAEYEAYLQLKAQLPVAYGVEELTQETMQAIAACQMDARHGHLNSLMDDGL